MKLNPFAINILYKGNTQNNREKYISRTNKLIWNMHHLSFGIGGIVAWVWYNISFRITETAADAIFYYCRQCVIKSKWYFAYSWQIWQWLSGTERRNLSWKILIQWECWVHIAFTVSTTTFFWRFP